MRSWDDDPVIIIDDELSFTSALALELERCGVGVELAADGAGAAALLRRFDKARAIVLEPNLPGASWYQLLHLAARSTAPANIVVLTAFWSGALAEEARGLGVRICLPKPVSLRELRELLNADHQARSPLVAPEPPWPERPTSLALMEWEHLNRTIQQCSGNMSQAARLLGIHRPTLYKKLRKCPSRAPSP